MKTKILKYEIYNKSKSQLLDYIKGSKKINIISGNPEVLYTGLYNEQLFENFTDKNSIIIPDGVGTVLASKIVRAPVTEKIAGIEVMDEILQYCAEEGKSIYLLGAKEEILRECIIKMKDKYNGIIIAGSHNGYFEINSCADIIKEIKEESPYVIFVAMGAPRQEIFISTYMDELPCQVFMGVGGSFDVLAGRVKRAPKWMINTGLEWLYRVAKEPWRIRRLTSIPKFLVKVMTYKD